MFILKHRFINFISISFVTHVSLALLVLLLMPKHEKFIPIEIHFGALGNPGTGASGSGKGLPQFKSSTSVPLPLSKVPPAKIPKNVTKLRSAPTQSLEGAKAIADKSDPGQVTQATNAIGGLSSGTVGNSGEVRGNGNSGTGGAGQDTPLSRYVQKIVLLIESHKNYPQRAKYLGQEGTVSLKIVIDRDGKVLQTEVLEAPPFKLLTNAAAAIITEIGTFPPMPSEVTLDTLTLNVPIRYRLIE